MTQPAHYGEVHIPAKHGRLHCVLRGQGPPLLCLHGSLGTGSTHFREQLEVFASSYQVIAPTFLGYGRSQRRQSLDEHFYERDAEDIVALIQYLELSPVHLCGFSDGAIVGMMVASDQTSLVRSLILIGGQAVLDKQGMEETRRLLPVDQLPPSFQSALARTHGDPYWKQLVTDSVRVTERLYEQGGNLVRERLAMIRCPTLIIQGEEDRWVGPEHAKMLHQAIEGSQFEVFPGAGHEVQREQPQAFNRRVLEFLAALG